MRGRWDPGGDLRDELDNLTNKGQFVRSGCGTRCRRAMRSNCTESARAGAVDRAHLRRVVRAAADADARGVAHRDRARPAEPYLVYLCSSHNVARPVSRVHPVVAPGDRSSEDERLRRIGIVVRPHPVPTSSGGASSCRPQRRVWRTGEHPVAQQARADFFDTPRTRPSGSTPRRSRRRSSAVC